jgi:hypothetical protein
VRSREPGTPPLGALRDHLIEVVWNTVYLDAGPDGHAFTAAIEASPALRAYEITLFHQAEANLSQALADASTSHPLRAPGASRGRGHAPTAPLISAIWLAAARVAVASHRTLDGDPARIASEAAALIDEVLCRLESCS